MKICLVSTGSDTITVGPEHGDRERVAPAESTGERLDGPSARQHECHRRDEFGNRRHGRQLRPGDQPGAFGSPPGLGTGQSALRSLVAPRWANGLVLHSTADMFLTVPSSTSAGKQPREGDVTASVAEETRDDERRVDEHRVDEHRVDSRRVGDFRRRLLHGLAASIDERGYRESTVADIVRHARTSKRTFYDQFSTKEECFVELLAVNNEELVEAIRQCVDPQAKWQDQVRQALVSYVREHRRQTAITLSWIRELPALGDGARPVLRRSFGRLTTMLVDLTSNP